jgi:microcystin-dependent protein
MPISKNTALFSLLGTQFGGNGTTTFGLPDLRGATMVGAAQGGVIGTVGGAENVTLTTPTIPAHTHGFNAQTAAGINRLNNTAPFEILAQPKLGGAASADNIQLYVSNPSQTSLTTLSADSIANNGNGMPHNNMPPFIVMVNCIAITGIYPSRN